MKKAISFILALIICISVMPLSVSADGGNVLAVTERGLSYNELSATFEGSYDGVIIQQSTDGINWQDVEKRSYYYSDISVNTTPKSVVYYRLIPYQEDYDYILGEYTTTLGEATNAVEVYPVLYSFNFYCNNYDGKINLSWYVYDDNLKYYDGFDVFKTVNGSAQAYAGSVGASQYKTASNDEFDYTYTENAPSKTAYFNTYTVKPYFVYNGAKYYLYESSETAKAEYVSQDVISIKTQRKKIKITLKAVSGIQSYKLKLTKYNLKTGKTVSKSTVNTSKKSYTVKADTKNYGYSVEAYPVVNGNMFSYGVYKDSHDGFTLMNSVGKSKNKTIKVINTRGKKTQTAWSYKLTSKEKKIIKSFFKKKYKGKNPSRAEMAYYALEWINKNVDYDYAYKYGNLSYVDAIFNKKKGQCLQYNGAFAAVLTYLGYEARVIEGYRTDYNGKPTVNHFWCEVKLNGRWYLCETGNYGKNGEWSYFASLYRNSRGYTKNGKAAKD